MEREKARECGLRKNKRRRLETRESEEWAAFTERSVIEETSSGSWKGREGESEDAVTSGRTDGV